MSILLTGAGPAVNGEAEPGGPGVEFTWGTAYYAWGPVFFVWS